MKKNLVVLTGAGISAESGLKTFRDSDGLWNGYNIADVATPGGWEKDKQMVLDFYNERRKDVAEAQPNTAHIGLAKLQENFNVIIVTQNIDDLHERAGSKHVVHLHGEIFKMRSELGLEPVYLTNGDIKLGDLADDGGQLRPFIVWFEEPVPMIEYAATICTNADIFVVIGTSLAVYPAAGLIDYAPPYCPKYIIDKNIPDVQGFRNLIKIEKPATIGVQELIEILLKDKAE